VVGGGKKKSTHSRGEKVAKHNKKSPPFQEEREVKGKKNCSSISIEKCGYMKYNHIHLTIDKLKVSKNCTCVPKKKRLEKEKNGSPFRERMEVGGKNLKQNVCPFQKKEVEDK
jgi:hypothetical protein